MGVYAHRNFSSGEVSPSVTVQSDSEIYQSGLEYCKNFIPLRDGSLANRPGTEFILEAGDVLRLESVGAWLVLFRRSSDDTVFIQGWREETGVVGVEVDTKVEGCLPSDVPEIVTAPTLDGLLLFHQSFSTKKVWVSSFQFWRVTEYAFLPNLFPVNVPGYSLIKFADDPGVYGGVRIDGETDAPTFRTGGTYTKGGHEYGIMLLHRDASTTVVSNAKVTASDMLTNAETGDELKAVAAIYKGNAKDATLYSSPLYMLGHPVPDKDVGKKLVVDVPEEFAPTVRGGVRNATWFYKDGASWRAGNGGVSLLVSEETDGSIDLDTFFGRKWASVTGGHAYAYGDFNTRLGTFLSSDGYALNRFSGNLQLFFGSSTALGTGNSSAAKVADSRYTYTSRDGIPVKIGDIKVSELKSNASGTIRASYAATVLYGGSSVGESAPVFIYLKSEPTKTTGNIKIWGTILNRYEVSGIKIWRRLKAEREEDKGFGFVRAFGTEVLDGFGRFTLEDDTALDADFKAELPPSSPPFPEDDKENVSTGTSYQQRLVVASSVRLPDTVTASALGNEGDFTWFKENAGASDAFRFALPGDFKILNMVDLRSLLIFTDKAEFAVPRDAPFTASGIAVQRQSGEGSEPIRPLPFETSVLYVQRGGRVIRSFGFDFNVDGYRGTDLTQFAAHLFRNRRVVSWAYTRAPENLVWCAMDDGSVLCLTYSKTRGTVAWSRQDFGSKVKWVAAVGDDLFFLTDRGLERMKPRDDDSVYLDAYVEGEGPYISGFGHLAGEEVGIITESGSVLSSPLAEGYALPPIKVKANGVLPVPGSTGKVRAGLPIDARVATLPLDAPGPNTSFVQRLLVAAVTVYLQRSRGVFLGGAGFGHMDEIKSKVDERGNFVLLNGPESAPVRGSWQKEGGQVYLAQWHPLPAHVSMVVAEGDLK